jgi:hypothetical protein
MHTVTNQVSGYPIRHRTRHRDGAARHRHDAQRPRRHRHNANGAGGALGCITQRSKVAFAPVKRMLALPLIALFALPAGAAQAAARTDGSAAAPAQIAQLVTHVPAATLDRVGAGEIAGPADFNILRLHRRLEIKGKPELLSLNLAWCPHCAATNWALAVALSRFGALTGLRVIDTGTYYCTLVANPCSVGRNPCFPHTHGLSFLDAGYTSRFLRFNDLVVQDVHGHNLQKPTRKENATLNQFDPQGEAPALDFGGDFAFLNSGYSPGALVHKTWSQIAGSLADPRTQIARHIDGLANLFTAAICKVTKGHPGAVCRSSGVRAAGSAHLH